MLPILWLALSLVAYPVASPHPSVRPSASPPPLKFSLGAYGSASRGNTEYVDAGGKTQFYYRWDSGRKFRLKDELYYYHGYGYSSWMDKGIARFDQPLIHNFGTFLYSLGQTDEAKKINKELEESLGLSWNLFKSIFTEVRSGYRYTDAQRPTVHAWVIVYGIYAFLPVLDTLYLSAQLEYQYPIYDNRSRRYWQWRDNRIWAMLRAEIPVRDWIYFYLESDHWYVGRPEPYTDNVDWYLRFGLDFWYPNARLARFE